jgi:dihydroxyacetone kinase phosphotransfer subunit
VIGIVVVSHSPALADAAVRLALGMAGDTPLRLRVAAGTADGAIGTDAIAIASAIDEVASPDGVLVLMDLGSAILSAGMALEFAATDARVVLSPAPFVEGLIAAVVGAASGASLDSVDAEARRALEAKSAHLSGSGPVETAVAPMPGPVDGVAAASFEATIRNPSGLHARPAATFVKTVGRYDADVTVSDLDSGKGPVSAASLVSLMALGVTRGTRVRVDARGAEADAVARALEDLILDGFGESEDSADSLR